MQPPFTLAEFLVAMDKGKLGTGAGPPGVGYKAFKNRKLEIVTLEGCILDTSIDEPHKMADFSPSDPAYKDVLEKDLVTNVYQDGQWGSYRRIAMKSCGALKKLTELAVLDQPTSGDLDSLEWFESQLRYSLPLSRDADADLILCSVYYASVNHRDVVLATEKTLMRGHIAGAEYGFGQEFSGRDTQGRRVMGVVQSHAIATMVAANSLLLWDVPESWTLEQASTVPLAYSTAYYALFVRANMGPGETVLVHPGSTCLGLAAISIALSVGATVFTTVGSDKERQLLNRKFPQMKNWQLLSSRDIFLLDHISQHTGGKGVDFVLNCSGGRLPWTEQYPDAHKRGPSTSPLLGAVSLTPKIITVGGNFLDALHSADAQPDRRRVLQLVRDGISSGAVRPLDATVFKSDQAAEAFRSAASEADLRKVVIQVRPEESDRNTGPPPPLSVNAVARTNFYAHKAYIIAGGLCTFGMELADWMISRGCRKLILTSGCGERTGHHMLYLHRWQCVGAKVRISNTDISTAGGTREIIGEAADMGPVGGIFNLESVLLNTLPEGQAVQDWEALCERKVNATNLLDQTSRKLCPQLDHFVVFSSACYGRGHPGKAHCHYADSAAERICERRAADGLPGLAIQWGAISDVKTANDNVGSDVPISGYEPQRISSCLETMERFLNQRHPVVSSVIRAAASHSMLVSKDRQDLVLAVAQILGFNDPSQIDSSATLADLGMDSVMGVDVLHAIERHCDLTLCINEVRLLSLKALLEMTDGSRERKYA